MFLIQLISKFIKMLRAGESPPLIAGGFTMGFIIGLSPFLTLQNMLILIIAILTKVNLASAFFAIFLFGFVAFIFDPLFHNLGYFLLTQIDALQGLWATLYNWPVAPFTKFYNTIIMGSLITALVLALPIYFLAKNGIIAYRRSYGEKIEKSKFMKAVKGNFVVKGYIKIRDMEF